MEPGEGWEGKGSRFPLDWNLCLRRPIGEGGGDGTRGSLLHPPALVVGMATQTHPHESNKAFTC